MKLDLTLNSPKNAVIYIYYKYTSIYKINFMSNSSVSLFFIDISATVWSRDTCHTSKERYDSQLSDEPDI